MTDVSEAVWVDRVAAEWRGHEPDGGVLAGGPGGEARLSPGVVDEARGLTGERLEAELCLLAAVDGSLMYRRLALLAEFDQRELAAGWGMASTAAWLAWQTALDGRTAREQVRVARALAALPVTSEAMARGELSYSKVRALTRFATPGSEVSLVELARHTTAAQLDVVAKWAVRAMAEPVEVGAAGPVPAVEAAVRTWVDDAGMRVIWARLAPDDGAVVLAALDAFAEAAHGEASEGGPSGSAEPPGRTVEAAGGTSNGSAEPPRGTVEEAGGGAGGAGGDACGAPAAGDVASADDGDEAAAGADRSGGRHEARPGEPVFRDGCFVYPDDDDGPFTDVVVDPDGRFVGVPGPLSGSAEPHAGRALGAGAGRAAALVAMAETAMAGGGEVALAPERFLINVVANLAALGVGGGASVGEASVPLTGVGGLPPGSLGVLDDGAAVSSAVVRRLACSEPLALVVNDRDGNPLYMGRKTRLATRRQRRAALARSGGVCAFPACQRRALLQVHHCDPWGQGGSTDIDRLAAVCRYHHWCLHEGGFRAEPAPGGFAFFRADGRKVEDVPSPTAGLSLAEIRERLERIAPARPMVAAPWSGSGERMDLDLTITGVCSALARAR